MLRRRARQRIRPSLLELLPDEFTPTEAERVLKLGQDSVAVWVRNLGLPAHTPIRKRFKNHRYTIYRDEFVRWVHARGYVMDRKFEGTVVSEGRA